MFAFLCCFLIFKAPILHLVDKYFLSHKNPDTLLTNTFEYENYPEVHQSTSLTEKMRLQRFTKVGGNEPEYNDVDEYDDVM